MQVARQLGKEVALVHDAVGLVLPRILSTIANEAMFAVMESVATPVDIDTAMTLGTHYPRGPLTWSERIGRKYIRAIMLALSRAYDPDRYRVARLMNHPGNQ